MLAFKFLDASMRSIHTGTQWRAAEWVETSRVEACRAGIHGCTVEDLAWWLGRQLWVIELDGEVSRSRHKVAASRARLVQRVDGYPATVYELGTVATWKARDLAVDALTTRGPTEAASRFASAAEIADLRSLRRWSFDSLDQSTPVGALATLAADAAVLLSETEPAEAPFIGCCAAGLAAAMPDGRRETYDAAFDAERRWQSAWLASRLSLV